MPACCSPLNGVTTGAGAPGSQPSRNGSLGSLNHRPRWYWWVGANVVVPPGDTEKVSRSKTPRTEAEPTPWPLALRSVWYHDTPNGLFGCWITNRSNSALRGAPKMVTCMRSFSDPGVIRTTPPMCGRQALMPGDGTRAKVNEWLLAAEAVVTGLAPAADAPRPSDRARVAPAATTVAAPRERLLRCLMVIMTGLPCCRRLVSGRGTQLRVRKVHCLFGMFISR